MALSACNLRAEAGACSAPIASTFAKTGDEVNSTDIIKSYEVGKGDFIELAPEELEAVAIESKRSIDIDAA